LSIRRLSILLAIIALLALAPPAAARLPTGFVGITSEDVFANDENYRTSNLGGQASIGVQLLRQTFNWSEIETSPGVYDLSYHDAYVLKAAAHGIRVLPIVFNAPAFHEQAGGSGNTACPPSNLGTMASFAQVLVRRYGPSGTLWSDNPGVPRKPITAWQIWNEPNLGVYWCNRASARAYVQMLKVVGRAIEAVDRSAEIVTAGLPPSKLSTAVPLARYIAQMYRARAKRYFDTLAINSYATNTRELSRLLDSIRRQMNRRRDSRAKIWITELGWGDSGPRHRFVVGASRQASLITSSYRYIRRNRRRLGLRGVVYFSWRDAPPYPPDYKDLWGLHTGLLDIDGRPKLAYYSFKKAVGRLR
jgi:hypothetical protein